jgi:group I intron endonuclease
MGIIYLIKNKINEKCYIGQTTYSLKKRFREHCQSHSLIGKALREYGAINFEKLVIKDIKNEKLNEEEVSFINEYNCIAPNGYNIEKGGGKIRIDRFFSDKQMCLKCKEIKEVSEFHFNGYKLNRRMSICKSCRSVRKRVPLSDERKNLDSCINQSLYRSIKRNRSGYIWEKLFGYTLNDLKNYIEKQFLADMSWDNFGSVWWIDKIIPRSAFRYSNVYNDEFKKCWDLRNLRPSYRIDCIKKKNRVMWDLIVEYNLTDILPIGLMIIDRK